MNGSPLSSRLTNVAYKAANTAAPSDSVALVVRMLLGSPMYVDTDPPVGSALRVVVVSPESGGAVLDDPSPVVPVVSVGSAEQDAITRAMTASKANHVLVRFIPFLLVRYAS
jgi:hypothetical protein